MGVVEHHRETGKSAGITKAISKRKVQKRRNQLWDREKSASFNRHGILGLSHNIEKSRLSLTLGNQQLSSHEALLTFLLLKNGAKRQKIHLSPRNKSNKIMELGLLAKRVSRL